MLTTTQSLTQEHLDSVWAVIEKVRQQGAPRRGMRRGLCTRAGCARMLPLQCACAVDVHAALMRIAPSPAACRSLHACMQRQYARHTPLCLPDCTSTPRTTQEDTYDAVKGHVFDLLAEVALRCAPQQLEMLLARVERWTAGGGTDTQRLLGLLVAMAQSDKEARAPCCAIT